MGLSSDLISQFAKVTTSNKEKKPTESTLFGTAVEYDGKMYVKLDGSELLTPVSTTTSVEDGERVTVLLKNHNATVTGNLSSPAVRKDTVDKIDGKVEEIGNQITEFEIVVADKVSTTELDAERARIETLIAEDVTIRGLISANEALIKELEAENATITGKLEVNEAEIENLQANKLEVTIANATYATIKELEATNADIHNLEADYGEFADLTAQRFSAIDADFKNLDSVYATITQLAAEQARIDFLETNSLTADSAVIKNLQTDVADIDTLIFGSASGSVIQTSFANAVIAQLGNAQIKSAMIENLSASKITSGDIITNNVRVLSEDGKLLISDETIQISDDTRVRVQIGKDADNDYSINIWDADGKLMFSEGGITDSAIKEAIIRNDMVSDTANISAHKLDISSLFEEINGSTHTIKSSKIYLSDQEQTLNVAFTSMITDLEDLEGTVTSQGTELSVVQGQIASKIWKEDIDAVSGGASTKFTEIEQELDSLSATVAEHTTTIGNKADSSEVTEVSDKVSAVELSLNGFKSTVSSTYATKTDLSALTTRVSTAESEIDQNADAIALRVTKTEMDNTLAGYSTTSEMNAAIELKADEINSSVASIYATQTELASVEDKTDNAQSDIDNLEIGGRNLIILSTIIDAYRLGGNGETFGSPYSSVTSHISTRSEKYVTLTVYTVYKQYEVDTYFQLGFYTEDGTFISRPLMTEANVSEERSSWTLEIPSNASSMRVSFPTSIKNKVKLEYGNRATDWSPAPEDISEEVNKLETRVTTAETNITQNTEQIALRATKTELTTVQTQAANAQNAADAAQTSVDTLEIGGRNYYKSTSAITQLTQGEYTDSEGNVTYHDVIITRPHDDCPNGFHITGARVLGSNMGSIRIHDVINGDGDWTVSFWIRGSQSVAVRLYVDICDSTPVAVLTNSDNSWKRVEITATVSNYEETRYNFVDFSRIDWAYFYIKDLKIEKGNRATDWTPAPEDVEDKIDNTANDIHQTIASQYTELVSTCESMILKAAESYTSISEYESFKQTVESELKLLTDQLSLKFTQTNESLTNMNNNLQSQLNTITTYFTFDVDGMTIGKVDNPNQVVIANDTISILVNGNVVQEFDADGNALTPALQITKSLNLFGYLIDVDVNGNVNCELVDDYYLQFGRNLVLNSNVAVSSDAYCIKSGYEMSDYLDATKKYTVSLCVTPAAGVTYFGMYLSSGSSGHSAALYTDGTTNKQIITKTFTPLYASDKTPDVSESYGKPYIYRFPNDGTVTGASTIHWIKIEPGDTATGWSAAPEDNT